MEGSWVTWPQSPSLLLSNQRGTLPHLSCWERECWAQAPACLPAPAHVPACERLILAPGLFSLHGGNPGDRSGKKATKRDREVWKQGPRACLIVLFSPLRGPGREGSLATMQSGYEEDAVLVLKLVVQLTQQFPICIVNQHQNPWPHTVSLDEQLWPLF